jgi:alkanesulfonate monooxygenase SsuD/methylene tetrahydromethanopterin reductase-like flavin-dependent oxidoreductase (luciferase family)
VSDAYASAAKGTPALQISALFPLQPTEMSQLVPFGQLVRESSATRLWLGQALSIESHPALACLAGTGCRIPVGIGVGLMALRHPVDAAMQARSLAALMGHPVTIGYGAADPGFVASLHGRPYQRPAAAVEEYITVARGLLTGKRVVHHGDLFDVDHVLPAFEHPPVEIGAGVLRPAMARAAGRCADAAITWLTPRRYLRETIVPALNAGRGPAAAPRLICMVQAGVDRPGRNPMLLAQHGAGNHLRTLHYTDMLRKAGLDVHRSDPAAGARELVEEGVFAYGKPGDIAAELLRYQEIGVSEVILNVTGVALFHGLDAALNDLHEILGEFG